MYVCWELPLTAQSPHTESARERQERESGIEGQGEGGRRGDRDREREVGDGRGGAVGERRRDEDTSSSSTPYTVSLDEPPYSQKNHQQAAEPDLVLGITNLAEYR